MTRYRELLSTFTRGGRARRLAPIAVIIGGLLVAAVGVLIWGLTRDGKETETTAVQVSPTGDDVPRLTPVIVTFASAPRVTEGSALLSLEPATPGTYAWLSDRILIFQPDYPGLLRGNEYQVVVHARQAGLDRDWKGSFVTAGELRVETVIPSDGDTEVPANGQVLVQFSRAVAPLTTLSAMSAGNVISFDPPLEGAGEWLNTSLYRFVPRSLPPNTTFTVRIPAGLSSAADGVLKEDFRWSFSTYGPAVNSFDPAPDSTGVNVRTTVTLTFNQPMDRAATEKAFALEGTDGSRVPGSFAWPEPATMVFRPAAQLARQAAYVAKLPAGVPGANGGQTDVTFTSTFVTIPAPGVARVSPGIGQQNAWRYGISVTFATPVDPDTVEGRVSVSGIADADLNLNVYPYSEYELQVGVTLQPSTDYTVTIREGIIDRYGDPVPPFSWSFRTAPRQPAVSYATPGWYGTFGASTEPLLYFHAVNVSEANFTLWSLTPVEAASARRSPPNDVPANPWTPSQAPLRQWTVPVTAALDEIVLASTSLSGGGPLPKGDYFVRSSGNWNGRMFFSVVDTAIVTKETFDSLLAWVVDYDSGAPVAGVAVEAGGPYLSGPSRVMTDGNGIASFALLKTYDRTEAPSEGRWGYVVSVDSDGRKGVQNTGWTGDLNLWEKDIRYSTYEPARKYVGQVHPDRPLYRPGEEVFLRGVIRLDEDAAYAIPATDVPFTLTVRDPDDTVVLEKTVSVNEFGTFAASLVLGEVAPVGDYSVIVAGPKTGVNTWRVDPTVVGNVFTVAEFRKPEFEVSAAAAAEAFADGDIATVEARATYYFGGAVSGAKVEWTASAVPGAVRIPGFERFSFADFDYYRPFGEGWTSPTKGAATMDDDGRVVVAVPAALPDAKTSQRYTVGLTVTDASNQGVASSAGFWVHPAATLAGIRPESYVSQTGEPARYEVAAIGLAGNPLPDIAVTVRFYERRWVTSKQRTVEGGYLYKSEPVDTLLETQNTTTGADGRNSVLYAATKPGMLRVVAEVTDSAGRTARSAAYSWIWGGGSPGWRVTNDDLIDLVADRDTYEVGDTARILVPAPFSGATGLVTVERAKVQSVEIRQFSTSAETIEIPIFDRAVPTVYVGVVLYRPPTAEDPVPRYKVGYVKLPVSTEVRELTVDVTPDRPRAQPGEKVQFTIQVRDSTGRGVQAELSVAVVDKALLALKEERGLDGLAAFWFERGLGVLTKSSLGVSVDRANDAIKEYSEGGGKGGGGLDDPRLREDFRNLAFWEGQLRTDASGRATVEVTLPDNLTTWHLSARAVTRDGPQVGEGRAEVMATQPLLLRPALPRFLRVGDASSLRLVITNGTATPADVRVAIEAEGVELGDSSDKTATVRGDGSAVLEWPVTVTTPGQAKVAFRAASTTGLADAVALEFPIKFDLTPEATATGGVVRDQAMVEAVFLPQFADLTNGSLEVSVQRTLTGTLSGDLALFPVHPWPEGTDYIASRLIATLAVERAERSAGMDVSRHERAITRDLADLYSRRRAGGGLAWCSYHLCPASDEATAIALVAFGEAKRNGHPVDGTIVSGAQSFLKGALSGVSTTPTPIARPDSLSKPDSLSPPGSAGSPGVRPAAPRAGAPDPNRMAYYLYAITVAGNPDAPAGQVRSIVEQRRGELTNSGRSYLLLAMAEAGTSATDPFVVRLLNDLTSSVVPSANGNVFSDPALPDQVSTALAASAILRFQSTHPLLEETVRWLMRARRDPYTWHVQNARLILALADYAVSTGELAGEYDYTVRLKDDTLLEGRFGQSEGPQTNSATVPLERLGAGTVSLVNLLREFSKPGRLYYTMALRYLTPATEVESLNRGIAVSHEYSLLEDPSKRIDSADVGAIVRVKVTVVTPVDRHDVRVDDFLPAGLEPIDPALRTTDPNLIAQLEAERRAAAAATGGRGGYMAPWCRWYYSPWDAAELRDDRLTLRASYLPRGVHEYVYYVRATLAGDYFVAPAVAEEAFFPDVFGRSDSGRFVVAP